MYLIGRFVRAIVWKLFDLLRLRQPFHWKKLGTLLQANDFSPLLLKQLENFELFWCNVFFKRSRTKRFHTIAQPPSRKTLSSSKMVANLVFTSMQHDLKGRKKPSLYKIIFHFHARFYVNDSVDYNAYKLQITNSLLFL